MPINLEETQMPKHAIKTWKIPQSHIIEKSINIMSQELEEIPDN